MKFHDYALNESTLLASRLLARRSKASLAELHALRHALDQAVESFEGTVSEWAKVDHDQEIREVADHLNAAAASQAEALVKSAKAEAVAEVAALRAELERHAHERAELEAKLEAAAASARTEIEAAAAKARTEVDAAVGVADTLRAEVAAQKDQVRRAHTEHTRLQDAHKITEAALRDAIAAKAQDGRARAALEAELAGLRASLARMGQVCGELDACTTIPDVVTTVAAALGADFPRVALFTVKGNHFEGMYQAGFDFETDISKLVVPITMNALMGKAVGSGRVETMERSATDGAAGAPFGGSPTFTLAMPIAVHGEVRWVAYADNADGASDKSGVPPAQQTAFAELVRRQALPVLEKLSLAPRLAAELRAYAKTLIDQIESMYAVDIESGEHGKRVAERLEDNLRCAREMYARRVEGESPVAARLFDERLAATLKERSASTFGRDLAALLARRSGDQAVRAS